MAVMCVITTFTSINLPQPDQLHVQLLIDVLMINTGYKFYSQVGYIYWNGTEIEMMVYLDCIHKLASIAFVVFIKNNLLPDTSGHYS